MAGTRAAVGARGEPRRTSGWKVGQLWHQSRGSGPRRTAENLETPCSDTSTSLAGGAAQENRGEPLFSEGVVAQWFVVRLASADRL